MDKDTLRETIGCNITKYRKQAGMTQAQLAELFALVQLSFRGSNVGRK